MRTKVLLCLMVLLTITGLVFAQEDEWWVGKPIKDITFEGLEYIQTSDLEGIIATYKGESFSDSIYNGLLEKLYADFFTDVQTIAIQGDENKNTVILRFVVKEKPVVGTINLIGNKKVRRTDILAAVSIKEQDVFIQSKLWMDERAVRDLYLEKGYTNIRVIGKADKAPNGTITISFNIDEGRQTTVKTINFEGNTAASAKTLKGVMSLKEPTLFKPGAFKESLVEQDKTAILKYYNDKGFIDAQITNVIRETDIVSDPAKDQVSLTFVIKEGDSYSYGGITFEGNKIFSTEQLTSLLRLKSGDVFNMTQFQTDFQAIANLYFENGYTRNYIAPEAKRDNERKIVSYKIVIVEEERSHIENIIIRGNLKTKDHVILREFDLESGDIFSNTKVQNGLRSLYNLQYFSSVAPDIESGSSPSLVNLVLNVEEQNTASIQFGVTFSGITDANSFPISLFASWSESNFLGNGQSISSNLTLSPNTQSLSFSFGESWFANKPVSVGFSLGVSHSLLTCGQDILGKIFTDDDWDNAEDNNIPPDPYDTWEEYKDAGSIPDAYLMEYQNWSFSAGMNTGYKWRPVFADVTLRGGLSFGLVHNFYDSAIYRPADKIIREKSKKWTWDNAAWLRLSVDDRDLTYDPSKGWFASQQLTWQGLFPEVELEYYLRSDTKLEGYFTLWNTILGESFNFKGVLASTFGFSALKSVANHKISESNKLSVDGMFVGRGWSSVSSSTTGQALFTSNTELRVPVVPGMLAFDLFFDAASTWQSTTDMITTNWADNTFYFSFGPGIRFTIPQFPFRLMFANCFKMKDGKFEWKGASSNSTSWEFVLSFNITNS